jgi:hypothetical protein
LQQRNQEHNTMGRPPIGRRAMTSTERSRRYRAGMAATKPATKSAASGSPDALAAKDREIARLKARIAELEALPATRPATAAPERVKLSVGDHNKLVRNLHPDRWAHLNDDALSLALNQAFQIHQQLFEPIKKAAEQGRKRPIDWPEVESAVRTYTEGKTKVTINAVLKAAHARVPALNAQDFTEVPGERIGAFIDGCLHRLGFRRRGEMTYERAAS